MLYRALKLCPEVTSRIFHYLETPDLRSCALVNRQWREIGIPLIWEEIDQEVNIGDVVDYLESNDEKAERGKFVQRCSFIFNRQSCALDTHTYLQFLRFTPNLREVYMYLEIDQKEMMAKAANVTLSLDVLSAISWAISKSCVSSVDMNIQVCLDSSTSQNLLPRSTLDRLAQALKLLSPMIIRLRTGIMHSRLQDIIRAMPNLCELYYSTGITEKDASFFIPPETRSFSIAYSNQQMCNTFELSSESGHQVEELSIGGILLKETFLDKMGMFSRLTELSITNAHIEFPATRYAVPSLSSLKIFNLTDCRLYTLFAVQILRSTLVLQRFTCNRVDDLRNFNDDLLKLLSSKAELVELELPRPKDINERPLYTPCGIAMLSRCKHLKLLTIGILSVTFRLILDLGLACPELNTIVMLPSHIKAYNYKEFNGQGALDILLKGVDPQRRLLRPALLFTSEHSCIDVEYIKETWKEMMDLMNGGEFSGSVC
ncbi:hypothetical protein NEOLI_002299 [Neolecta irregularis DAH-3]|uniref:F-box domain-containing protein n=1 Tax=Neolecta irregularis (strain DAH-3) TaxID=1198029 RepID=A0A1U7LR89_NEOID|nr:hypothetical protein NEOLI_002299 [Neolecta irregularis DAH-3]|eukprot:OLL25186.1 hypothetical protein NEOLI_002299 [Neolecta irregularis DAH-3]